MNLAELAISLNARAAGLWQVYPKDLVQIEFWSAPDLSLEVASSFSKATQQVDRSRVELGIVGAVLAAHPRVSVAQDLHADSGSGYWLRQFDADRSIAVPLVREGEPIAVASVAIRGSEDDRTIALVTEFLESWAEGAEGLDSPRATFQNE